VLYSVQYSTTAVVLCEGIGGCGGAHCHHHWDYLLVSFCLRFLSFSLSILHFLLLLSFFFFCWFVVGFTIDRGGTDEAAESERKDSLVVAEGEEDDGSSSSY